jgi:hypothetical protein
MNNEGCNPIKKEIKPEGRGERITPFFKKFTLFFPFYSYVCNSILEDSIDSSEHQEVGTW